MGRYSLKRVGQSVLILFCVSVIVFVFVNMAPGDPYTQRLDPSVSAEVRGGNADENGVLRPHSRQISQVDRRGPPGGFRLFHQV